MKEERWNPFYVKKSSDFRKNKHHLIHFSFSICLQILIILDGLNMSGETWFTGFCSGSPPTAPHSHQMSLQDEAVNKRTPHLHGDQGGTDLPAPNGAWWEPSWCRRPDAPSRCFTQVLLIPQVVFSLVQLFQNKTSHQNSTFDHCLIRFYFNCFKVEIFWSLLRHF